MRIGIDRVTTGGATEGGNVSGATTTTFNHVVSSTSTNVLLIVTVKQDAGGATTSVKWDNAGTPESLTLNGSSTTGTCRTEIWYLKNPTARGTKQIAVAWSGAHDGQASAITFTNVHQTSTFNAASPQTASGASGSDPSLSITSAVGEVTIDCAVQDLASSGTQPIKGTAQNWIGSELNTNATTIEGGGSWRESAAASVTHTWTMKAASGAWCQVGVSIKPIADDAEPCWLIQQ